MVVVEKILEEVQALAQRVDQMEPATEEASQVEETRKQIRDVYGLLSSLPDRIAEAIATALVKQQQLIVEAVHQEFLRAEAPSKSEDH